MAVGHYLASNVIVDRGYPVMSTTYPVIAGHGVANLLTRRLSVTFQGAGAAGRYIAATLGTTPTFRVGLVWLVGCTLAGAYRIRIASAVGTGGSAVYDATYTYASGPCVFLLPGHYAGAVVNVFGPTAGVLEIQRLVLADWLDVSGTFRTDWGQILVDPNDAQSSAPGGSFVDTSQVARRQRSFSLSPMTDADVWGADAANGHGTSFSEICASCGTTGEVLLLPRVTPGELGAGNATALRDFSIYGTFDRAPSFKAMGQANPDGSGKGPSSFIDSDKTKFRRLWQTGALSLQSISAG